ncbi:MAG: hypothetical protein ACRDPE_15450 [Solirubrobacterales bacterium]
MKVDYDSEGHSLLFEFGAFGKDDHVEEMATGECFVWILDGHASSIQLLDADKSLEPLDEVAQRFEFDKLELRAAALAALAAPDREITIEVGAQRLLGDEAKAA